MSEADCRELLERVQRVTKGGGNTVLQIHSTWTGNVRWARNQINTSGEVRTNFIEIFRILNGSVNATLIVNDTSTAALLAAVRRAERMARLDLERPQSDLVTRYTPEQPLAPKLFSETTYQLDANKRAAAAVALAQSAADAGMLSAGYIEVSAHSQALLDTYGRAWYFPYTQSQYSVTVRDPKGTGSGWAGVDWYDWSKIDGLKLSQIALDKCLKSRDAAKIEPGRYTSILEPQAVCDFVGLLFQQVPMDRPIVENPENGSPFFKAAGEGTRPNMSKLGDLMIDARLSIGADPMDPELGFPPFDLNWERVGLNKFYRPVFHPAMWFEHGVLTNLPYDREYALAGMGRETGLPNSKAFHMTGSGPATSIEEMIATTKRGLLVTRFDQVSLLDPKSVLCRGHTRDGLWLIESGKISKPVKNMYFTESVLSALNSVEQIGTPQRVFHPPVMTPVAPPNPQPVVTPALKIRDFSFTALDDAV